MSFTWTARGRSVPLRRRALVMGVVNVTPDSFSDGGRFLDTARAVAHARALIAQGADILDIGGESSRPGADPVDADEELRRVLPVVEALARDTDAILSVDTVKAAVADACLAAGAHVVNDITALTGDGDMIDVCRRHGAGVVLMHMQGTPRTMQANPEYENVVREVCEALQARLFAAAKAGIAEDRVALDPGIGFGKTFRHNLELLAGLDRLANLGRPVVLGVSRKSFLGKILGGRDADGRGPASLAAACFALSRGTAHVLRVHDVRETRDAAEVIAALNPPPG